MTITIGRCGYDVTLPEPSQIDLQGESLRISGFLRSTSSLADVLTLKQQLMGLVDSPDEPFIPITWSLDARVDGFYAPTGVFVAPLDQSSLSRAPYTHQWEGTFERVSSYIAPRFEGTVTVPGATNAHGVTSAEYDFVVGLPVSTLDFYGTGFNTTPRTRTSADGLVPIVWTDATAPQTLLANVTPSPSAGGACSVQVGSSLRTVVGRQVESGQLGTNKDAWRLQNGLVRVTWDNTNGELDVSHYDGTTWETAKNYDIGRVPSFPLIKIHSFRVIRNTPEMVIIRLGMGELSTLDFGSLYEVDLGIRRGEYLVSVIFKTALAVGQALGVQRATAEAGTATSSSAPFTSAAGLRATATDASGNRYLIFTTLANTRDTTQGRVVTSSSVQIAPFWITTMPNYASVQTYDDEQQQICQAFSGVADAWTIGAR